MLTGDAAYIKKINRSLIVSKIIELGMVSRADLAKITGLNKATISVQVSDLLSEGLIIETLQEHITLGRRPIMLSINEQAGFVLGIDLEKNFITFTLSNMNGLPVQTDTSELVSYEYDVILKHLIAHIKNYQEQCAWTRYGLAGIVIGVHGIVNNDELIYFVPQHHWQTKNLKKDLKKAINVEVLVENNANLCSFAEKVFTHHQCSYLLSISLGSGIGLGIMVNGEALKGHNGYAGEIGHMIVVPDGKPCNCGNKGCFEQYASEASFLKQLSEIQNKLDSKIDDVKSLFSEHDPNIHEQTEQFLKYLAIGLNNIINLYNPEILVINSQLLQIIPDAVHKTKGYLTSNISHYYGLVISELGNKACVMGACALAIKNFLEVSELCLTISADHQ